MKYPKTKSKQKFTFEDKQVLFRDRLLLQSFLYAIGIISVSIIVLLLTQFRTVTETQRSENKRLPEEIQETLRLNPIRSSVKVPILLYHYVENVLNKRDIVRESLNIPPSVFENQIKTLSENGYTFMTMSELTGVLNGSKILPPKPIVITIDDGHWDLYTDILPILEKNHAKATAYIISGFIGGPDFLTTEQLSKVIQSGLVEIGAHTMHHIELAKKLSPVVQYEVYQSKNTLENVYKIRVESFAYPNGSFDQQAASIVKDAGFTSAVSTVSGIDQSQENKYFLYRLRPGRRTGNELLQYLEKEYTMDRPIRKLQMN